MEYTGNFNDEDDFFLDVMQNFSQDIYPSLTPYSYSNIDIEEKDQLKDLSSSPLKSSSGFLISFSSSQEENIAIVKSHLEEINACQASGGNNNNNNIMYKRTPLQAQEHVTAERKRREKMGELFISLSKLVPGLKKLDKSSILGDTIEYMKELQQQVKVLEKIKKNIPSACENINDSSSSKENVNCIDDQVLGSKIKARILDKSVLINIHCNKRDGVVGKVLFEMEQLHLSVNDIRIMPFGRTYLEISILAEMENGCCITVQDIVNALQINILDQVQS
ncbi:transcription factor bHLH25-like [Nicotiana tabacum]|uniref:Transcription factor bHLH18-like n=1 Tax=Nicotiana tabacum TaxID=4097 RepID=A0A1S4D5W6_TOBAC|nr:transcription factor bHLH18-like isoform X1 [Nicotiana tomentosiformis]XP_016508733.1 PREDICTED: transcription factor bHLH18-like [Nicotiana tabacum]